MCVCVCVCVCVLHSPPLISLTPPGGRCKADAEGVVVSGHEMIGHKGVFVVYSY